MIPVAEIQSLIPKAREMTAGLSREKIMAPAASGGWSVAQCLEHLNTSNRLYVAAISDGIERGKAEGLKGTGPFTMSLFERLFVWMLKPPVRFRVKAPKVFTPLSIPDPAQIVSEWEQIHQRLAALAGEAAGLHLTKIKIPSPASNKMTISLLAAFEVIAAHDRRHLWQAEQTLSGK